MMPATTAVPPATAPMPPLAHAAPQDCRACATRTRCLPALFDDEAIDRFAPALIGQASLKRHQRLFSKGERVDLLFSVRSGQIKTERPVADERAQVASFYLPGQLVGLEGLASKRHGCDAVALCDSSVCAISYARLTTLMQHDRPLLERFHSLFAAELARQQSNALLLGNARAPQRLAAFLLNMAACDGDAPCAPVVELRMSRDDIASYLGLALESVSRQLTQFRAAGLLEVNNRRIELRDPAGLRAIAVLSGGA